MSATEVMRADELVEEIESGIPTQDTPASVQNNPYIGIASAPFPTEAIEVLMQPMNDTDIEIRPDGLIYLPEIKYRRILNRAFGPGAWSLLPMEITVAQQDNMLYYKGALFVLGRFVSEAIGEQQYFPDNDRMSYATAAESAKSNCLMRCCKDLGIASELWDPTYTRSWVAQNAAEVWCVNIGTKDGGRKKKMWRKKNAPAIDMYPWKEDGYADKSTNSENFSVSTPQFERPGGEPNRAPAPNGRQAAPVRSTSPAVTIKQAGRFKAIAKSFGWNEKEYSALLASFGFKSAEEIVRDDYEKICSALENPIILADIRSGAGIDDSRAEKLARELPF